MQHLTFEKFCFVSAMGFLSLVMISTQAEAAGLQQIVLSRSGLKVQAFGLFGLYIAAKIFRPDSRHF